MSRAAVQDILQKIDALSAADRKRLEQELAARADREWAAATKQARTRAREKKITQTAIDRAVESVRYGRR